jgi:hypothetical protein
MTFNRDYRDKNMSEKMKFKDIDGKDVAGQFRVSDGKVIVTAPDGRTQTVDIEQSMLGTDTLARMLLLQMHRHEGEQIET